ncbi:metalloendopeptidase [Nostoc sp. RF31YmG]|nr:metalloendopeptidase [Nostoc sp. RF31YmG]
MPESKSKFLIPTIGAAVVLTGGIAAYMYFKGGPTGDSAGALGSAKVVPSSALMATYITTDPQAWAKLQQFGTPEAQQLVAKGLESFNKDMLKDSNISYEKDIKPWAGSVMIAVLPPNAVKPAQFNTPAASNKPIKLQSEPNILLVVGIKDKIAALNFGNKLKAQKGIKFQESDYKGEKITETTDKGKPTYSVVLNNSQLILAPEKQAVEQAIDTFKGQPSFATKEGASNILSKGVDVKNTLAQIYIPDYAGMVQQLAAANPQGTQLPPQTLKQLQQVKSMVAGVGVDDAGLRVKAIANLDPQLNKFQYQNTPAKIVGQFPTDTFALVSGQGISRTWSTVLEQSKDYPEFNQAVAQVRQQLKAVANLDLDKEVLGWMDGEFALGTIPSNQGILASVGFGGALLFDTSDRKTAEATLSKLDDLVKKQSLNVAQRDISGKKITEWQIPQQGALLAHGWLDEDTLFVALGSPIADAIATNKSQSLDNSDTFKAVTGSLQKPNGGYFYVDMDKTMTLVNRFAVAQPVPPEASAVLSSIRGLGVTATSPDKSTSQVEMLLALKPKTAK